MDTDYRIVTPQGAVKSCRIRGRLILDEQGIPALAIGTTEDITARKLAEGQVIAYQERLRALAAELTLAEERERRRIAAELHDRVGQTLALVRIQLAAASRASSDARLVARLGEASESIRTAIQDTRELVFDLSSPLLNEIGLGAAVSEWLEAEIGAKHDLRTEFVDDGRDKPLDEDVRAILYRNVRELLTNVVRHAHASRVSVRLERAGTQVVVVVRDDGVGCDPNAVSGTTQRGGGFGLFSIQERMADLGGSLEIVSAPGQGCTATLTAPLKLRGFTESE
jgi:signal transduction histidine kinase